MEFWRAILDVVMLLAGALLLGLLFERYRQSAILGYLLAGTLLGPAGTNLIQSEELIPTFAELGTALLLFTLGLEFSWRHLRQLGGVALGGGTLQVVITLAATSAIAHGLGTPLPAAIALGGIVALSSTACVVRILRGRTELDSYHGRIAIGILLLQDIATVPLVLIVAAFASEGTAVQVISGVTRALGLGFLLALTFHLASLHVLPRLFSASTFARNRELAIILAVVTCLTAAWAAQALGLSPILGSFVAGMLLAESPFSSQIRADVGSLRALFVTLFFASIGMLADLVFVWDHLWLVIGTVAAIVAGKTIVVWGVCRFFGVPHRHAFATGLCIAQVGEFSFVLVKTATDGNLLSETSFRLVVASTVATLFLTPFLVGMAPRAGTWVKQRLRRVDIGVSTVRPGPLPAPRRRAHVLVIGFGPAGRRAAQRARALDLPVLVLELNPVSVALATHLGFEARVGDATQAEVLEHAEVQAASAVVVTLPDHRTALQVIHQVKALGPAIPILVRARYHRYAEELRNTGAQVIDEEHETGSLLGELLLPEAQSRREA